MPRDDTPSLPALVLNEPFRPQFHFTPQKGWLNDPNGLVFYEGEYHLFYQFYPDDTVWGPMHWGHAVSRDLVNWQHLPIALFPDELGYIYSGSAVIDWHDTAGFGKEAMVLVFTHHHPDTLNQSQSLACSIDNGRSWTKYAGNPILSPSENFRDFRDPKVFWYEAEAGLGHWVMAVSAKNEILFYASDNLIDWQENGRFHHPQNPETRLWETPDLFQLPIAGRSESRWVLTIGTGDQIPGSKIGTQYVIGQFDGKTFTLDNQAGDMYWADFGADFFAAQAWNSVPDKRKIWIAWMNNWRYAEKTPASTWRGALTIPRALRLVETEVGLRLAQTPLSELKQLRDARWLWQNIAVQPAQPFRPFVKGNTLEIIAEFEGIAHADQLGVRVLSSNGNAMTIGCDPQKQILFTDRRQAGQVDFHEEFPSVHQAELPLANGRLHLHIFVDRSMVEVFANDGLICFSERVFPDESSTGIEIFTEGVAVQLKSLAVFELKTAVFNSPPISLEEAKSISQ